MSNIKKVEFVPPPVNADIVEMMEDWLARAKRGEVKTIGIAAINQQNFVQTNWCGWNDSHPGQILGAIETLKFRMLRMNVPEEDED